MGTNLFVIVVMIVSLILGSILGFFLFKIKSNREDKEIIKNAKEVLEGKRKNVLVVDGKEYEASQFLIKNDEGNNIIIDLKGGGVIKNAPKKIKEEIQISQDPEVSDNPPFDEDSRCSGEKKRNFGTRLRGRGRTRRFG